MSHVEPIYSSLGADPVLGEIVEVFVDEIPSRIEGLVSQAAAEDWEALGRTAHQLKGAFGSYGFDQLTPNALCLEKAARERQPEEQIREALDDLIGMCKRVRSGIPVSTSLDSGNAIQQNREMITRY